MKIVLTFLVIMFCSCETNRFDADKRQLLAKDAIRSQIKGSYSQFDIERFQQDTLTQFADSVLTRPIRYTLHFQYVDSSGALRHKTGEVLFPHNGISVISSRIIDQQP